MIKKVVTQFIQMIPGVYYQIELIEKMIMRTNVTMKVNISTHFYWQFNRILPCFFCPQLPHRFFRMKMIHYYVFLIFFLIFVLNQLITSFFHTMLLPEQ